MPALLEGGCRVTGLREGIPVREGPLRIWSHVDRSLGASAISLRVLDCAAGRSPVLRNASCDELLYVLAGGGSILLDGIPYPLVPETGIFVRPGIGFALDNPGGEALTLISSRCPDPGPNDGVEPPRSALRVEPDTARHPPLVRLWEQEAEVTGDRWYRVLVGAKLGSVQATQFVGAIPPGRAPDHFHDYEEVLCILAGQGRMWAGATSAPIGPGSCVFLPRQQVHCVENTGKAELRLLGVFHPSGSPAVSYGAPLA